MRGKRRKAGEIRETATVGELLQSGGIQLAVAAKEFAFTDAAYGEAWILETAEKFVTLSELMAIAHYEHHRILASLRINLPDGVYAITIENPLLTENRNGASHDDDAPAGEEMGEPPF